MKFELWVENSLHRYTIIRGTLISFIIYFIPECKYAVQRGFGVFNLRNYKNMLHETYKLNFYSIRRKCSNIQLGLQKLSSCIICVKYYYSINAQ